MAAAIQYPAVCLNGPRMWVEKQEPFPATSLGIRRSRGRMWELCDSTGQAFLVGDLTPERPLTFLDRLRNTWFTGTRYGKIEPIGHWSLVELKKRVCIRFRQNSDFWEAVQPVVYWTAEVQAAATHREVIDVLDSPWSETREKLQKQQLDRMVRMCNAVADGKAELCDVCGQPLTFQTEEDGWQTLRCPDGCTCWPMKPP